MKTGLAPIAVALCFTCAGAALAQSVTTDLNGDGPAEEFQLVLKDGGDADLLITGTGQADLRAANIATTGPGAEPPLIEILGDGQVRVTSFHDAVGPVRWTVSLTLGFPDGSYRVTGYTFIWWNPLDLEDFGLCDLDLRGGSGVLQVGTGDPYEVDVETPALPVAVWSETDKVLPVDCQ